MDSNKHQQQQQQFIYSPSFSASLPQQHQQFILQHQHQQTSYPLHQSQSSQKKQQQQSSQTTTPIKYIAQNPPNIQQYLIQTSQPQQQQTPGQTLQFTYDQPKQYKITPEQQSEVRYDTHPNVKTDSPAVQYLRQQSSQQSQLGLVDRNPSEKVIAVKKEITQTNDLQNIEHDLEKEKNQNQILSAINNQLQNHILALETQLKSKVIQQHHYQQQEEGDDDGDLEDEEEEDNGNDIAEEDDEDEGDNNHSNNNNPHQKQQYKLNKIKKLDSKNSYNNDKIQLLEQENQQLQKVCEQLREQASRYQSTNTNKIQNSLKNLELEKSYLESTIKLEKMNVQDLQMKLNQITEEKVQIAFQLEEKSNEFEQYKIEQQMRVSDQYEKKIIDLDSKANSLIEQNRKIMNINDQLLQEIDALKETNEIMRGNHQNQIDEIKTYWKQQMQEESNKLNQILIQQSQQYEQSIQQIQSQTNENQQNLLNEQQRHLKTKNELKSMQLRAEEFEQKLSLSLKGNEQLMQVLEINQQDVNKWKLKFNEQQEKYIEEIEQMRTTVEQPHQQLSTQEQILSLQQEKNEILQQLNEQIQQNTKLTSEVKKLTSKSEENQQMFLEAIKLNEEMKVKIQLQIDIENRYINAQNTIQQNQRKTDNLEKKFEVILKENNKLNDQLTDRIKEVQIWQEKHKTLEVSLDQNFKQISTEFQMKLKQEWDSENQKFYNDFEKYEKIKEQQDQLIKDYHLEIQQLKTILTSRDEEINNVSVNYKKIQDSLPSNHPLKKLPFTTIINVQQQQQNLPNAATLHPYHLSQYQLPGGDTYYYQNQYQQQSEEQLILDQVNVFKDYEVTNLKRDNNELIHEIKVLKKRVDELQFSVLKKEQIIVQIEQDKRMLKEQVTQLHQNLNRKALSLKEKDFTLQTNYELELIIKELRDQLFLMESEKLKLSEQLFQAELRGGVGVVGGGQQNLIDLLQKENNQLKIQFASAQQQQRVMINVNDQQQLVWLQQENAILKQHLNQKSAIISEIENLQNCVLSNNDININNINNKSSSILQQQNLVSPSQNQKINFNQPITQHQSPSFQKIFSSNNALTKIITTNLINGGNNNNNNKQKENIQI